MRRGPTPSGQISGANGQIRSAAKHHTVCGASTRVIGDLRATDLVQIAQMPRPPFVALHVQSWTRKLHPLSNENRTGEAPIVGVAKTHPPMRLPRNSSCTIVLSRTEIQPVTRAEKDQPFSRKMQPLFGGPFVLKIEQKRLKSIFFHAKFAQFLMTLNGLVGRKIPQKTQQVFLIKTVGNPA